MVLTTEGGQTLHSSPSVVFLFLSVKPVLPKSPQRKPCPNQGVQKGCSLPADVSPAALADEILPQRPGHKSKRAVSSLPNRDHLTRLSGCFLRMRRNQMQREGTERKRCEVVGVSAGPELRLSAGVHVLSRVLNSCCGRKCSAPPRSTGKRMNRL